MDVLSDVLNTLQLRSTNAESLVVESHYENTVPCQHTLAHVVLSGSCTLHVDGEKNNLTLYPLDSFLLCGAQQYELEVISRGNSAHLLKCYYSFEANLPHPFIDHFPALLVLRSNDLTDRTELGQTASLLDDELVNARLGIDFVALKLAEIILVELLRRCQSEETQHVFLAALADSVTHIALQYIHGKPDYHWQVSELATSVGLSRSIFTERFHQYVGEPPARYARLWRLLKAYRELQSTTTSIKRIAERSGYSSSAGFSRAFQKFFGHPPSYLRLPSTEARTRTATSG
jgi:AraC-like DNA-binding protein